MWKLTSVTGEVQYILSEKIKYIVGRSADDLILNDRASKSEHQAYLYPDDNHMILIDAGSPFDTCYYDCESWIKIDKNDSIELRNSDRVYFGTRTNEWTVSLDKPIKNTNIGDHDTTHYENESGIESDNNEKSLFNIYSLFILLGVFVILISIIFKAPPTESKIENNKKKICSFADLKKTFPTQNNDLWDSITIGMEGILNKNPATPGVYLFLHENNHSTKDLVEKIANTSASCFNPNLQPLKLLTEDFISNDYGTVIEKYKKNIKDGGVLIVANLDEIPAESAQALHSICDSYSPIVERVIIFLTLTVNPDENGKLLAIAENKLNHLWGATIEQNILEPLISRVTESVLRLNSE